MRVNNILDTAFALLIIIVLAIMAWMLLATITEAQGGQYWYLTAHYSWEWYRNRWVRISYPVVCSGYICRPACHNYYGGWGPCR